MIVVDASAAVKFLVRETGTERARDLLRVADPLIAPDWVLVEAASTFWEKVKRSELLAVHAEQHMIDLPSFFETLHPAVDLIRPALKLSLRLRHPIYDCVYLALAVREGAALATADERLFALSQREGFGDRALLIA